MNVLSLFDGMSCGRIALERAGIQVDNYYSSEIKDYAIEVANTNYPQDKKNRLGDVTKNSLWDLPKIDLIIGGSPCQDFSGANKEREGVEGIKSRLFFSFIECLQRFKPKYFLLENVAMKEEHNDFISSLLGNMYPECVEQEELFRTGRLEPYIINSNLVSAQNRKRLYWTNIKGIIQPKNLGLKLNDFLVGGYSDRYKARTLLESDSRPLSTPIKMCHRYFNKGFTTLIFKSEEHCIALKKHFFANFKNKSAEEIDKLTDDIDLSIYDGVRYMTNEEREYCQTIPKGYTNGLTQNEAACVMGDGWTVDVIAHIFKNLT